MIVCPNCSGNLKFDIASQKMHCAYCDTYMEPSDVKEKPRDAQLVAESAAKNNDGYMEVTVYTCPQCGAELISSDNDATSFCSFCGASNILSERISRQKRPDGIIPFKITKEECKKRYQGKLSRAIFAPRELKNPKYIDSFRGIYMPYWTYDISQKGRVKLDGTKEHREGDYRVIEHFDLTAYLDGSYDGISHDGAKSFADNISESLAPYDVREEIDFNPAYLSGFYGEVADTRPEEYSDEALVIASNAAFDQVKKNECFSGLSVERPDDAHITSAMNSKVLKARRSMFPVWFMSYRNEDSRMAYAAINGQTGKVVADIPIDKKKYMLVTAIVALIVWIILNAFTTFTLAQILLFSVTGGAIGLAINNYVVGCVGNIVKDKKDSGHSWISALCILGVIGCCYFEFSFIMSLIIIFMTVMTQRSIRKLELPKKRGMFSNIALCVILVISAFIFGASLVQDAWFYVPALLTAVAIVASFFDILWYYNQLMTRPMPQFSKTGGDDNA